MHDTRYMIHMHMHHMHMQHATCNMQHAQYTRAHMTRAGAARVAAATGRGHATRLRARHRAGRLPAAAGAAGRPLKAVKAESRAQAAPVLHAGALRFVNIARRPAAPPSSWDLALGAVFIGTALFWSCFFVLCSSAFRSSGAKLHAPSRARVSQSLR